MATNAEVVQEFIRVFLLAPELTKQCVEQHLKDTDWEIRFLHSDPCKHHYTTENKRQSIFPWMTGEGRKGDDWCA